MMLMETEGRHNKPMKPAVAFGVRSLSAGRYTAGGFRLNLARVALYVLVPIAIPSAYARECPNEERIQREAKP